MKQTLKFKAFPQGNICCNSHTYPELTNPSFTDTKQCQREKKQDKPFLITWWNNKVDDFSQNTDLWYWALKKKLSTSDGVFHSGGRKWWKTASFQIVQTYLLSLKYSVVISRIENRPDLLTVLFRNRGLHTLTDCTRKPGREFLPLHELHNLQVMLR